MALWDYVSDREIFLRFAAKKLKESNFIDWNDNMCQAKLDVDKYLPKNKH